MGQNWTPIEGQFSTPIDIKDGLLFKWHKGAQTAAAAFGDPRSATDTALCLYDAAGLKAGAVIPADATRWTLKGKETSPKGYDFKDKAGGSDGVTLVKLKAGVDGKALVLLKGKGAGLALPGAATAAAYFDQAPVTAQVVNSLGECWSVTFTGPPQKNTGSAAVKPQYKNQCKATKTPCGP